MLIHENAKFLVPPVDLIPNYFSTSAYTLSNSEISLDDKSSPLNTMSLIVNNDEARNFYDYDKQSSMYFFNEKVPERKSSYDYLGDTSDINFDFMLLSPKEQQSNLESAVSQCIESYFPIPEDDLTFEIVFNEPDILVSKAINNDNLNINTSLDRSMNFAQNTTNFNIDSFSILETENSLRDVVGSFSLGDLSSCDANSDLFGVSFFDNFNQKHSNVLSNSPVSNEEVLELENISLVDASLGLSSNNEKGKKSEEVFNVSHSDVIMKTSTPIDIPQSSNKSPTPVNPGIDCKIQSKKLTSPGVTMVGAYSPDSRSSRIERFLNKRERRIWKKLVKYDVRKNFADSRLRVKGRFVKKEDEEMLRDLMKLI